MAENTDLAMAPSVDAPTTAETLENPTQDPTLEISATEQANYEAGLPQQDPTQDPTETQPAPESPVLPQDPYAGLNPVEIAIKKQEEMLFALTKQIEEQAKLANEMKAAYERDKAVLKAYDDLMAFVVGDNKELLALLEPNKEIVLQAIRESRIILGDGKTVHNGSIGLHHSDNGSRVINGGTLPAREPAITPEIAQQCRADYIAGKATRKELAARYNVTPGYMGNVLNNRRGNG
jgi:hypothetical protein